MFKRMTFQLKKSIQQRLLINAILLLLCSVLISQVSAKEISAPPQKGNPTAANYNEDAYEEGSYYQTSNSTGLDDDSMYIGRRCFTAGPCEINRSFSLFDISDLSSEVSVDVNNIQLNYGYIPRWGSDSSNDPESLIIEVYAFDAGILTNDYEANFSQLGEGTLLGTTSFDTGSAQADVTPSMNTALANAIESYRRDGVDNLGIGFKQVTESAPYSKLNMGFNLQFYYEEGVPPPPPPSVGDITNLQMDYNPVSQIEGEMTVTWDAYPGATHYIISTPDIFCSTVVTTNQYLSELEATSLPSYRLRILARSGTPSCSGSNIATSGNYSAFCDLNSTSPYCPLGITYQVHAKSLGWMNWVSDGAVAGTTGQSRRLEALRVELTNARDDMDVCYRVHMAGLGWGEAECNGDMAGTTGESRQIEATEIWLENPPITTNVCYRVHMKSLGWGDYSCNGYMAGTTGQSRRIEAIQISLQTEESLVAVEDDIQDDVDERANGAELTLISRQSVLWSDTSYGCSEPGHVYSRVTTSGWRLVFSDGVNEYHYHTWDDTWDEGGYLYCSDPYPSRGWSEREL